MTTKLRDTLEDRRKKNFKAELDKNDKLGNEIRTEKPMTNTKARHQEILSAAANLIALAGGVEAIGALPQDERKAAFTRLVNNVINQTGCARETARRNVAKVSRRNRHPDNWGGARTPGPGKTLGPDPLPEDEKRQRVSTRLAPGSKELAQAIAEILNLDGWGRVVDEALVRMVENDRELRAKLAEMGIILLGRG